MTTSFKDLRAFTTGPSWAYSMVSLLMGYFTAGSSWAYLNGEPSSGLLHSGAFLAYFDDEPSNGLLHSVPSWLISMMNLLTGFFTMCLLGLIQ